MSAASILTTSARTGLPGFQATAATRTTIPTIHSATSISLCEHIGPCPFRRPSRGLLSLASPGKCGDAEEGQRREGGDWDGRDEHRRDAGLPARHPYPQLRAPHPRLFFCGPVTNLNETITVGTVTECPVVVQNAVSRNLGPAVQTTSQAENCQQIPDSPFAVCLHVTP